MATLEQIIDEARSLSPGEKRKLREALDQELGPVSETDLDSNERVFLNRLQQKGLITAVPARLPDDDVRRNYQRVEVKGEPISETIIRERG